MTLLIALVNSTIPNPIHTYATNSPPVTIRANGWQALGTITSPAGSTVSFYEGAQAGAGTPVFSEDLPDGTIIDLRDAQTINMGTFTTQAAASGGGGGGGTTGGFTGTVGDSTHVAEVTVANGVVTAAQAVAIAFPPPSGGGGSSTLAIGTPVTGGTNGDALAIDSAGKLAAVPFPSGGGTTLPNLSPSPAGTYGDGTHTAEVTVNAEGLVTAAQSVPIAFPIVSGGSSFFKPTTVAQWQTALQNAFDQAFLLMMDPTTSVTSPTPMNIVASDHGQAMRGILANGATFQYTGSGPALTIKGGTVNGNRGILLEKLHLIGDYANGASMGLFVVSDSGASIYKLTTRDLYIDGFGTGMRDEGNIFESLHDNFQIENCVGDGFQIADGPGPAIDGIVSNVVIRTPNISRNGGWGIHASTAKSVDVVGGGSFIQDGLGAILGEQGIRSIQGIQGVENCGPVAFVLGGPADEGCLVTGCSGSNTATLNNGPMLYLIKYTGPAGGLVQNNNAMYAGTILAP